MQGAQPGIDLGQCGVGVDPGGPRQPDADGVSLEVGEDLVALLVIADHPRRAGEAGRLQVAQDGVHGRCPRAVHAV